MALPSHLPGQSVGDGGRRASSGVRLLVSLSLLLVAPFLLAPEAAAQPATKRVLILTGSDPNHPGFLTLTQRFRAVVRDGSSERVELLYELQEGLNTPPASPRDDEELTTYLKRKYGGQKIDLILASAAIRLSVLKKRDPALFAGIPLVFYDFEEDRDPTYRDLGPDITGVWAKVEYGKTLELALALHPEARRVVVIAGTSSAGRLHMERARAEFRKYEGRIEFTYLTDLTLAELKDRLAALPRDNIVYFLTFYTDKAGNRYPGAEALTLIAPTSGAPIYGHSESLLGAGIVGGYLFDFNGIGQRLGDVSLRILRGERPADIPSQTAPNVTTFDWRELRRWGISEQALPPGSVVRFKQPSLWELYRWHIIGLIAACIVEALLIAALLIARVRRRQAEAARRRSEEQNRATLRAVPDLMFLQRPDGVYLDYYARDQKELFVPPEEFVGKSVRDVMTPELAEMFMDCFRRVLESGDLQVVEYALTTGGEEHWYEARIVPSGENILSVVRDVTGRKQAEVALRDAMSDSERHRAQLESVFHAATDGFVVADMAGNVLFVNETMARMNGFESADEMKRNLGYFGTIYELFDTDGQPIPYDEWPLSKALRGESLTDRELRVRRNDIGREWFFSFSAEPVCNERGEQVMALLVTHDITERKLSEKALRESEERFRALADSAPVLIWVNGLEGCEFVSRGYLEFLGRPMDEVLGMDWTTAIHPDDVESYVETYRRAAEARETFTAHFRFRRSDGEYRWFKSIGLPRLTHDGTLLGYVGSSVDVTDIKHSQEALQRVLEEVNRLKNQLQEENIYLREEIKLEHNFSEIVGHSDAIKYVLHKIEQVAPTDSTVLIMGETGTGKELVARAIHSQSPRRSRPLVKVNCAALSASLVESELFGHEKGAFTGAVGRKIGRFELADGATLFLDEIGELPPELQVKLLRVIQEGEFERLGGTRTIRVDVRIIAATNRNLWEEVQQGRFREDLWYRLNVFPITTPPLRQRTEDIPLLVEHFVGVFAKRMGKRITSVAPATLRALRGYSWPGNVRELANVIERAVINRGGPVLQVSNISEARPAAPPPASNKTLEEMEREYIIAVLDETGWKIEGGRGAAQILGLHPSTLRTRMAKLKIRKPQEGMVGAGTERPLR